MTIIKHVPSNHPHRMSDMAHRVAITDTSATMHHLLHHPSFTERVTRRTALQCYILTHTFSESHRMSDTAHSLREKSTPVYGFPGGVSTVFSLKGSRPRPASTSRRIRLGGWQ